MALPAKHKALVVRDVNVKPEVELVPTPECLPGTAILKVMAAPVISYMKDIFLGNSRKYTFPLPIVPGTSSICRVAALPKDATSPQLKLGALVYVNCLVRERSNNKSGPAIYLSALHDGGSSASKALMADGGCRDGSYAEYMRVPLENIFVLNEDKLLGISSPDRSTFDYKINDLGHFPRFLVPYGGFRSINISIGESILIGPATGSFGASAVILALSMGLKVVAWGRSQEKLAAMESRLQTIQGGRYKHLLNTVVLVNDATKDVNAIIAANGQNKLDAAFDITPPSASGATYIKSAILSLRHGGRISLMGGIQDDVVIPHGFVMHQDITIKGKWMYEREDVLSLLQLVEFGILRLDAEGGACQTVAAYGLDEWMQAWDLAYERDGPGEVVILNPSSGSDTSD